MTMIMAKTLKNSLNLDLKSEIKLSIEMVKSNVTDLLQNEIRACSILCTG